MYVSMYEGLANRTRFSIMILLEDRPHSWSELMVKLEIRHKKTLHFHLLKLERHDLVERNASRKWQLAAGGKSYFNLSPAATLTVVKELIKKGDPELISTIDK